MICNCTQQCKALKDISCMHKIDHEEHSSCQNTHCHYLDITVKCIRNKIKWSEKEVEYLSELVSSVKYLYYDGIVGYRTYHLMTWKQISVIINDKFGNNRTAEACKCKYNNE